MSKRRPDLRALVVTALSAGFSLGVMLDALTVRPPSAPIGVALLLAAVVFGLIAARLYDGLANEEEKKHDGK